MAGVQHHLPQVLALQTPVLALPLLQVSLHVSEPGLHAGGRVLGSGGHSLGVSNLLAGLVCGRQWAGFSRVKRRPSWPPLPSGHHQVPSTRTSTGGVEDVETHPPSPTRWRLRASLLGQSRVALMPPLSPVSP